MDWKEYIIELELADKTLSFDFNVPASNNLLDELQTQFGLKEIPTELEELYRQTNGVDELLNEEKIGELIWSIDRVIKTNKEYRNLPDFKEVYMSFDQIFLFLTQEMVTYSVL